MIFEPLTAEHAMRLGPLEGIHSGYEMTPEMAAEAEVSGGYAGIDDGGNVLAIAGVAQKWPGVGLGWAWLAKGWRKHARRITAEVITVLNQSDFPRIEMGVLCDFEKGHRWAERLGFEVETPCAKSWGPDGKDYTIYVRLKS